VITTYCPDSSILDRAKRARVQVGHLIVVDDTGSDECGLEPGLLGSDVMYIKRDENLGIAKSLNIGVTAAMALGYKWVLTLDDDTLISKEYVAELLGFLNKGEIASGALGVIGLSRGGERQRSTSKDAEYRRKRALITSGSLINMDGFNAVGGFSEDMFIDLVDFDYCTRLRKKRYEVIQLATIGMQHKVGDSTIKHYLGIPVTIYNHSPFRLYYQTRNSLIFFKRNLLFDPILSCYILLDVIRVPMKAAFFEDQKMKRVVYLFRGIVDGVRGRTGRFVDRNNATKHV